MYAAAVADQLSTPILDAESSNLLQSISSHGGYAYVSMATLAASGDFRAAEAAREMAWEQLHSGPWHSVLPVWRDAYSMACLHVAKFHYRNGELKDALRVLDMGLIMGGMLLRKDLDSAVEIISAKTRENDDRCESFEKSEHNLAPEAEFDKVEVLQFLPAKSLSCKTVVNKSAPSMEAFLREHFLCGSPVIISDCMTHWPARKKWNDMDYLKRVAGDRTVPVEINELRDDICIPDYCFVGGGELRSVNAWFGPAGTVTPLHHDPHHNILAQVVGKKYIRLYPASLCEELYPHGETMLFNSSQVDLDNIDEKEFPKVHDLEFLDCILEEVTYWWSDTGSSAVS
ncbi:hypothetical protein MANES_06G168600v8 [Manihot esculenta]|uniref:Uncharacterized protein n=1 Tax=Manihot esculenta TaxID=3983 RepID=A0ACB7HK86_MANES|nr:hypothetical protein MANES_06G168600v8 [Manihot esculenta]